jgi:hypothetical protein
MLTICMIEIKKTFTQTQLHFRRFILKHNHINSNQMNDLAFLENWIGTTPQPLIHPPETIAIILSRGLTTEETRSITSWKSFEQKIRQLSADNLRRTLEEAHVERPFCKHTLTCSQNVIRGFLKSFGVFYSFKYGMNIIPSFLTGALFKDWRLLYKLAGRDTILFSLFMSSFSTSFKAALCALRRYRGVNDWKNSFAAGIAAGLTILIDQNKTRRQMIALYLSTRSFQFIARYVWRHYLEKNWYANTRLFYARDPHARAREVFERENTKPLASGGIQRDHGKIRGLPEKKQIMEIDDEVIMSPDVEGVKSPLALEVTLQSLHRPTINPDLIHGMKLSPVKAARLESVKRFIRHASATVVLMLSSSQILYAYICGICYTD